MREVWENWGAARNWSGEAELAVEETLPLLYLILVDPASELHLR